MLFRPICECLLRLKFCNEWHLILLNYNAEHSAEKIFLFCYGRIKFPTHSSLPHLAQHRYTFAFLFFFPLKTVLLNTGSSGRVKSILFSSDSGTLPNSIINSLFFKYTRKQKAVTFPFKFSSCGFFFSSYYLKILFHLPSKDPTSFL